MSKRRLQTRPHRKLVQKASSNETASQACPEGVEVPRLTYFQDIQDNGLIWFDSLRLCLPIAQANYRPTRGGKCGIGQDVMKHDHDATASAATRHDRVELGERMKRSELLPHLCSCERWLRGEGRDSRKQRIASNACADLCSPLYCCLADREGQTMTLRGLVV